MDLETVLGFASALVIGLSLGVIGGGGSILTAPVLTTAYSLFVVVATSFVGALQYMKKGLLSYRTGFLFATPSFTAVFITRKYIVPSIPEKVEASVAGDGFANILFGIVLVLGISFAAFLLMRVDLSKKSKFF